MDNEEENCTVYSVCRPDSRHQSEYYVAKFAASHNVDFTNCPGGARIERENNLKEFKSANDIDDMPKSGAGSEYGREQREEARRKRFGIRTRNYNPNDQPFILKLGAGEQQIRLKGTKNGGVSKNMNYVAFTSCGKSNIVSLPVRDWYDFTPMPKYKPLNSEEAEEEFSRRDKTYNHFAIMYNKKYKNKEDDDHEKEPKSKNNKRSNKQLLLTEFELMSGSEEDDSEKEEDKEEDKDSKKKKNKKRKKAKDEEDDAIAEAVEENDDADEGQELDYLSVSSDDDEDMRDDNEVYNEVGVAEEEGLKRFGSDDEEEEEDEVMMT